MWSKRKKESQVNEAGQQERALANCNLMQVICSTTNIRRAYKRVKQNKGAAGIDQMAVDKFADWFKDEGENLIKSLQSGMYEPNAVKLVEIPKPNGVTRMLGIPMVRDRIIQQAMNNNWFEEQGLYNLAWHYERFKNLKKPPCAKACTVV